MRYTHIWVVTRQTVNDDTECNVVITARIGGWSWQVWQTAVWTRQILAILATLSRWSADLEAGVHCAAKCLRKSSSAAFMVSYQVLFCAFPICGYRLWTDRQSSGSLSYLDQLHVTTLATRLMNRQAQYLLLQLSGSATCNYSSYPPYEQTSTVLASSAIRISYVGGPKRNRNFVIKNCVFIFRC